MLLSICADLIHQKLSCLPAIGFTSSPLSSFISCLFVIIVLWFHQPPCHRLFCHFCLKFFLMSISWLYGKSTWPTLLTCFLKLQVRSTAMKFHCDTSPHPGLSVKHCLSVNIFCCSWPDYLFPVVYVCRHRCSFIRSVLSLRKILPFSKTLSPSPEI